MKAKYLNELIDTNLLIKRQTVEELLIKKIVYESREAEDMCLFVAIKGFSTDGHDYLKNAMENGTVAAIVEKENKALSIPQYIVRDSRQALAHLAAEFYNPEINKMRIAGVTGTNGKTTTSFLIRSVFNAAGLNSGLIGTIHYDIGGKLIKAWNTTPESIDLFKMIYDMYLNGQRGCVLEASSHGLSLHRLDCLNLEVAVFTNLSQDHLDFHRDFEDYYQAKKLLFSHLKSNGHAIINRDDVFGQRLIYEIEAEVIDFGLSSAASVTAKNWESSPTGVGIDVQTPQGDFKIESPLIGQFNVENILAAIASGIAMNFDLETIRQGIENVSSIPGRLEPVPVNKDLNVIVDYAHTPDALQKALHVLEKVTDHDLWVVFGCGGDRDKKKRPLMGKIAEDFSDRVVITTDNPRNESPASIINDILAGITNHNKVKVEEDRRKAIQIALQEAKKGDTILVAGKGHEDYQEIKGIKYPFDDRQVIRESAS